MLGLLLYQDNMYMKSNLTNDVVSLGLQIDRSLLTHYCYSILSRIVGHF